ncbi:flagellar export chaperone FliS [Azohydromonas caseinilytica]|uniref:Flagellar secretion chaperone FliS n=1 Tax=Azohydromonas caseinilytica TaxID=2728836 RepID=A0A848F5L0_9BURK|nr:flagellar export chaperone FliS [Azohydromonas caseinilytica]NML14884.1 flagellar export chaperone FliS [Azohydromonas caseinilytica]
MYTGASPFAPRRAASAYHQVGVQTGVSAASPHKLVAMLFDGLIDAVAQAQGALAQDDVAAKCQALNRAVRIVEEGLRSALDLQQGGELAANLNDLYGYVTMRLTQANLRSDPAPLDECKRLIEPLREAWAAIAPQAEGAR